MPHLNLSEDEAAALIKALYDTINDDRYPQSPHIGTLRAILARLENVPYLRALDTWENEELRLHGLSQVHRKPDRPVEQISRNVLTIKRRQRG